MRVLRSGFLGRNFVSRETKFRLSKAGENWVIYIPRQTFLS